MRKTIYTFFIGTMLLLAGMSVDAQAFSNAYVDSVASTMSTFQWAKTGGNQPPAQTAASKIGNCLDMALYFTDTLDDYGLSTEIIGENYSNSTGTHYAPNDGHFIGIATDGKHAWVSSNQVIVEYNTVEAAIADGGVSSWSSGTTVFGQVVLSGGYDQCYKDIGSTYYNKK